MKGHRGGRGKGTAEGRWRSGGSRRCWHPCEMPAPHRTQCHQLWQMVARYCSPAPAGPGREPPSRRRQKHRERGAEKRKPGHGPADQPAPWTPCVRAQRLALDPTGKASGFARAGSVHVVIAKPQPPGVNRNATRRRNTAVTRTRYTNARPKGVSSNGVASATHRTEGKAARTRWSFHATVPLQHSDILPLPHDGFVPRPTTRNRRPPFSDQS